MIVVTVRVETPSTMARSGISIVEVTEAPESPDSVCSRTAMPVVPPSAPSATSTLPAWARRPIASSSGVQTEPIRTTTRDSSCTQTTHPVRAGRRTHAPSDQSAMSPAQPDQAPVAPVATM